jgi:RNA polymerase sigma factor (sigma-70 family)
MPSPQEEDTYTRRLSREIDAAYAAHKLGEQGNDTRLYRSFLAQAQNVVAHHFHGHQVPDVARDIATRAMMAVSEFRGESAVSTWFWSIAQNEAKRELRRHIVARERLVPLITVDEHGEERERSIEDKRGNNDARLDFEGLVRVLPPKQAEVMTLMREGHSLKDVARKIGKSPGTVRGRYRLAKAKLKNPRKKPQSHKK